MLLGISIHQLDVQIDKPHAKFTRAYEQLNPSQLMNQGIS